MSDFRPISQLTKIVKIGWLQKEEKDGFKILNPPGAMQLASAA